VAGKDLAIGTAHDMSPAFAMMLPGLFFFLGSAGVLR
jgi:hypothetical protein